MSRVITIFNDETCKWWVVPSQDLRRLIRKHAQKLLPGCDYILEYLDANGFGIELGMTMETEYAYLKAKLHASMRNPFAKFSEADDKRLQYVAKSLDQNRQEARS